MSLFILTVTLHEHMARPEEMKTMEVRAVLSPWNSFQASVLSILAELSLVSTFLLIGNGEDVNLE